MYIDNQPKRRALCYDVNTLSRINI